MSSAKNTARKRAKSPTKTTKKASLAETKIVDDSDKVAAVLEVDAGDSSIPSYVREHNLYTLVVILACVFVCGHTDVLSWITLKVTNNYHLDTNFPFLASSCGAALVTIMILSVPFGPVEARWPCYLFWKVLHGWLLLYCIYNTYLFFLPYGEPRWSLKHFDKNYGHGFMPQKDREDCRIFTPEEKALGKSMFNNAYKDVSDIHFYAHFVGWIVKMAIISDWYLAFIIGVFWETFERTTAHLPVNYDECYWDQIFLDAFGANFAGMIFGYFMMRRLNLNFMTWLWDPREGEAELETERAPLCPPFLHKKKWVGLTCMPRYLGATLLIIMLAHADNNNFMYILVLSLPNNHYLAKLRVATWAIVGIVASREVYRWVLAVPKKGAGAKMGPFAWMMFYGLTVELWMWTKNAQGLYTYGMQSGFLFTHHWHPINFILPSIWATIWLWGFSIVYHNTRQ